MKHFRTLTAMILAVMIAVSTAAAVFTPSVEYKEAPSIVEKTDDNGNAIAGEIKNSEGEVVGTVSSGAIKITALSTVKTDKADETDKEKPADKEVNEKVKERLLAAEAEL
ncbi:MAG: hypothetical protein IKY52_01070, partial [Clostridia bacterium]|nr:hypothetical protein [Clostridia bacterium]